MRSLRLLKRLPGDDRAQAMTEFVIVMPVVLLAFFLCIQTLLIAQANQLASYASFAAARSYATSFSKFRNQSSSNNSAHKKAETRARNAALLIMAPVSHAKPGEGLPLWRSMRNVMKFVGGRANRFYGLAEGYAVASMFRMKDFQVDRSGNSNRSVVKASFRYEMPISVPGLAEIWDYAAGKVKDDVTMDQTFVEGSFSSSSGFLVSMNEVLDGLSEMEKMTGLPVFGAMSSSVGDVISDVYSAGYQGAQYTVSIRSKSICGFEPWSGRIRTEDREPFCDPDPDDSRSDCIDAADANDEAAETLANECEEARLAKENYDLREAEYQTALAVYNNCINSAEDPADCDDEKDARDTAKTARDNAYDNAEKQADECSDAEDDADATRAAMEAACE